VRIVARRFARAPLALILAASSHDMTAWEASMTRSSSRLAYRLPMVSGALLLASAGAALAHHGWSSYETAKVFIIIGPVLELRYQNPHGELWLDHGGKRWTVTLAPITRMNARGLSAADLAVGKTVTVEGYPSRVHDAEMRAERITAAGKNVELR